jgi:hypothetical protein
MLNSPQQSEPGALRPTRCVGQGSYLEVILIKPIKFGFVGHIPLGWRIGDPSPNSYPKPGGVWLSFCPFHVRVSLLPFDFLGFWKALGLWVEALSSDNESHRPGAVATIAAKKGRPRQPRQKSIAILCSMFI